jgi:23S rRNA (cytidine1920-2'-O)/16S rRNA (cytidine1409-2'-O)-methyltransferase
MKSRLDILLVERGLVPSRERAKALIMEGKVLVNSTPAAKAGDMIDVDAELSVKEPLPYVSRGGVKLAAALDHFNISLAEMAVMDVGISTGGFTDCMLKRGARRVYGIDVGYGQVDLAIRNDPRVVLMERTNIRYLDRPAIPEEIGFAAIDVSFISLRLVIGKVREFLSENAGLVALVKPQFEVGKGEVGKGGIVRDENKRLSAVKSVSEAFEAARYDVKGVITSPILGQKGNVEYLLYAIRRQDGRAEG